jgi:hypothetical protein
MNPCEDRPAPYETYLYIYDCKSGEEFFKELKDDDILDLESQVINWVNEHFCGELVIDLPLCDFEGDYHASIKTDFNSPDSVVVWESAGFYLK